ncbi:CubicO group peptidase, beta-lactamase class C family [Singulisphaera sp. GP187]|uniref:serine hydrolase domain-containing protein n=1 Tax=Singulisphaera sp. GP187 TaxID=1882752 RepID=UPI0009281E1D|nr:serine hydrolase domain-containing protein [Singulisphaera sp. GP187]SIO31885.1 CubicO group peptidase, beta-lactamase class C family [Singulisphaera sp. GP187]
MRRVRPWMSALALLFIVAVTLVSAARAEDLASQVDEFMESRVQRDRFSGSILVARDGKVLVRRGYGMANLEHDVPNMPETKFRLGSITKQFTAMAVMILQEQGKIDVHEKIKKYLPDAPPAWDEITVHHLLTHTAGIPSFTGFADYPTMMRRHMTLENLVASFKDKPLEFKPGERFAYSNSGYVLLGLLIEKVSGKPYASVLQASIFEPLGMKATGYDNPLPVLKHRASGYSGPGPFRMNSSFVDMTVPHAAGALYSTVDDLFLWDQALLTETLVPKAAREAMFTPEKKNYGYGWGITKLFGRRTVSHGGGINGFVTHLLRLPEDQVCVVVLSNVEGTAVGALAEDLAAVTLGEKPKHESGGKEAVSSRKETLDLKGKP